MATEPVASAAATTELQFHKMHGAGNDFVLLDWRDSAAELSPGLAALLADRRRGIGCDQILILRASPLADCLAAYEIRNADGSAAGQCGNGARCIALYLQMQGANDRQFTLDSPAGRIKVTPCSDGEFELNMGEPRFEAEEIPILAEPVDGFFEVDSEFGTLHFGAASMGNPHALLEVQSIDHDEIEAVGAFLVTHEVFPESCNIGFAELLDRRSFRLRVFERGVGETLACGSGACAAMAILHRAGQVDDEVQVFLPGGVLVIKWKVTGEGILMKGPATHVYSGSLILDQAKGMNGE